MRKERISAANGREQQAANLKQVIDATHLHLRTEGETVIAQALAARGPSLRIQVEQSATFIERACGILGIVLIDERFGTVSRKGSANV